MPFDPAPFRARRERVASLLGDGALVLPSAPQTLRNGTTRHPYRQDSHFHWLCGFPEPGSAAVLLGGDSPRHILFCQPKDPERETWEGFLHGPASAAAAFGFDEAYPLGELDARLPELLRGRPSLSGPFGADPAWDARAFGWIRQAQASRPGSCARLSDARLLLGEERLLKDPSEIAHLRRACAISDAAHRAAMLAAVPGAFEYEAEAELLREFRRGGAAGPAYPSIVASGRNACVLHYTDNHAPLRAGDLLLIDAGAEFSGYAADITRTFPVDGRFAGPARDLYQIVLAAQAAAIAAVRPGAAFGDPHRAACSALAEGLIGLGLLEGTPESAIESQSLRRFYMHRTSHWLGLDVHDTGSYREGEDDRERSLLPGMVLTIEPGLYLPEREDIPEPFRGIGIRIEDDLLVSESGSEVLSAATPKSIPDLEEWLRRRPD